MARGGGKGTSPDYLSARFARRFFFPFFPNAEPGHRLVNYTCNNFVHLTPESTPGCPEVC